MAATVKIFMNNLFQDDNGQKWMILDYFVNDILVKYETNLVRFLRNLFHNKKYQRELTLKTQTFLRQDRFSERGQK